MTTANKALATPANGADVDSWDVPVNANSTAVDAALGSTTTINVTGASGTNVLTSTQYGPCFFVFSGTLTANVTYQVPSTVGGFWWMLNSASGAFTITISSGGAGTSIVLPASTLTNVHSDGTNIRKGSASSGANSDITSLSGLGLTGVVKGQGASQPLIAAVAGTDYAKPDTDSSWTGKESFAGTTGKIAALFTNAGEIAMVSASSATGTIAYYLSSQSILYFTANAAANWTINLTFASTPTTLDSVMSSGQCLTCVHMVTQGSPAFFNSTVQVDGTTTGVTTIWQGGAPTSGNVSGVDIYTYAIIKTGSATFTVLASVVQFL